MGDRNERATFMQQASSAQVPSLPLSRSEPSIPVSRSTDERASESPQSLNTQQMLINPPGADIEISRSAAALPPASLSFRDLAFSLPQSKGKSTVILEPCSGHFEPGQLVALMGPSGCGKSTLLDMLAMKKTAKYTGQVFVNGRPRDPETFQRIAAYVGQDDVMPAHSTVAEAVDFNVRLKRQRIPKKERQEIVSTLLQAFGLDSVKNSYVGGPHVRGISGGQRRRVSLVKGVAAQASILFCDEPTSGLSATDAELCIKGLRTIAKRLGVLVVVVIHQPRQEVAKLFDTLVLMTSKPGRMTYFGPMDGALDYVRDCSYAIPEHVNTTDFLMDLVTPGTSIDASDALAAIFDVRQKPRLLQQVLQATNSRGDSSSSVGSGGSSGSGSSSGSSSSGRKMLKAYLGGRRGPTAAPFCSQFAALLRRKLQLTLRNPMAIGLQLGLPVVMGFLLGFVFKGVGEGLEKTDAIGFVVHVVPFIFILLTMLGLQSMPVMPLLVESRHYMKSEVSEALYSETAAVLVSFCVDVPLALLAATVQTVIIYLFSGLPMEFFDTVVFWCVLVFFFFDGVFSLVSAIAADAQQAQTMATPFVSIFMIFNGFIVSKGAAPVALRWIFNISPTFYGLQATVSTVAASVSSGDVVLKQFMFSPDGNVQGILTIVSLTVVLRFLQTIALSRFNNIQK